MHPLFRTNAIYFVSLHYTHVCSLALFLNEQRSWVPLQLISTKDAIVDNSYPCLFIDVIARIVPGVTFASRIIEKGRHSEPDQLGDAYGIVALL
uniref:Uncharacterized protein n=1 Tax=Glossina palpalis gambiensis TaxID=67801 RepID=A0A1B0BS80_9MUSC